MAEARQRGAFPAPRRPPRTPKMAISDGHIRWRCPCAAAAVVVRWWRTARTGATCRNDATSMPLVRSSQWAPPGRSERRRVCEVEHVSKTSKQVVSKRIRRLVAASTAAGTTAGSPLQQQRGHRCNNSGVTATTTAGLPLQQQRGHRYNNSVVTATTTAGLRAR